MIGAIGLLDGITATIIILTSTIFGILSFYNARKLGAKLLYYAGLMMISIGLFWLGPFTDLLKVLITGTNLSPPYIYGWLSYLWVGPSIIVAMYLGSELLAPNRKKSIVIIYAILGALFDVLIFVFPPYKAGTYGTFKFAPYTPGVDLIDTGFQMPFPAFWLVAFFLISVFIFEGIGFAIKAKKASGTLRKKFIFLSLGFIIFVICGALDSVLDFSF
ncbi:MAG: hypothetical protein P8Y70_12600 [Candidatus Lokiarchaeota archaeon]